MADSSADIAATKAQLRAKLRFRRDQYAANLSEFVRAIAFRAAPAPLRHLLETVPTIGGYVAQANEAPVDGLLAIAANAGRVTALPFFVGRDARMAFTDWCSGDAVEPGPWRVAQPVDHKAIVIPGLLLCPLLGFDRSGGRIGQGGGHYDRFLEQHPETLRIGIAWSVQEVDAVPREPHDLALDAILTEQEWILTGDRL